MKTKTDREQGSRRRDRAMLGVYIHIPFCRSLCPYCDFVRQPLAGGVPRPFTDALCGELESFDGPAEADTVYVGGGTPSLLAPDDLGRILAAVRRRFTLVDPEVTIEANPDDCAPALADAWQDLGVNRVSLGVQSFDDRVLRYLGRRHDAAGARRACELVADRFDNWGMDLIFGAHPSDAWSATLTAALAYAPPHLSTYGLTYERGTPFGERREEAIDDATWLRLYRQAHAELTGYVRYEISNFARPGRECRHNLIYWRNEEYAGFGPGAYSFLDGVRSRNLTALADYVASPDEKGEALHLTDREIRTETVIQHLRLKSGLKKKDYYRRFGRDVCNDFGPAIAGLVKRGLLAEDTKVIRPTAFGFELNTEIGLELVD